MSQTLGSRINAAIAARDVEALKALALELQQLHEDRTLQPYFQAAGAIRDALRRSWAIYAEFDRVSDALQAAGEPVNNLHAESQLARAQLAGVEGFARFLRDRHLTIPNPVDDSLLVSGDWLPTEAALGDDLPSTRAALFGN